MSLIQPTEKDGEWVGEALAGVLPDELDSRVWIQGKETEYEGRLTNQFMLKGRDLVVLATVSPLQIANSDEKKVSYHVIAFRRDGDKIKRPNEADISRVRQTFFARDLTPEEKIHEGQVGDQKAHHWMTVFTWKPIILTGE